MVVEEVLKHRGTEASDTRQQEEHMREPEGVVRVLDGLVLHEGRVHLLTRLLDGSAVGQGMEVCRKKKHK